MWAQPGSLLSFLQILTADLLWAGWKWTVDWKKSKLIKNSWYVHVMKQHLKAPTKYIPTKSLQKENFTALCKVKRPFASFQCKMHTWGMYCVKIYFLWQYDCTALKKISSGFSPLCLQVSPCILKDGRSAWYTEQMGLEGCEGSYYTGINSIPFPSIAGKHFTWLRQEIPHLLLPSYFFLKNF